MSEKRERICPVCGRSYTDPPALSRRDNKTDICPECGMREALAAIPRRETPAERTRRAVYAPGNKVNPQNVFLVGTRSLDEGEWDLIEREKLSVYTMETIHLKGIGFVAEDIKRKLKERKIRNVHFSIDVDSIDPRFAPGTGTRVCEGLMPDEFNNFVAHMLSTNLIKSMDLVELNPELDVNEQTTSLCLQIIDYITARL